jgi:hypothetical protein
MKRVTIALPVVAVSLFVAACTGPPEEEKTAESSSALDQNGNGCVILNPDCALAPWAAHSGWAPDADGFGGDPASCVDRARQWSVWCGNPAGAVTASQFLVHGNPVAQGGYVGNASRCVVSLGGCRSLGWGPVTFGDDWLNSGSDPARCQARAKEWSDYCVNPSGLGSRSVFEAPGVHLEFGYVAP